MEGSRPWAPRSSCWQSAAHPGRWRPPAAGWPSWRHAGAACARRRDQHPQPRRRAAGCRLSPDPHPARPGHVRLADHRRAVRPHRPGRPGGSRLRPHLDQLPADGPATDGARPAPGPAPGLAGIRIDAETGTVTLPVGTRLDPGGIAKGYTADLLCTQLRAGGAAGACVNVGGDLRVSGTAPRGGPWKVAVPHPYGGQAATLQLTEGADAPALSGAPGTPAAGRSPPDRPAHRPTGPDRHPPSHRGRGRGVAGRDAGPSSSPKEAIMARTGGPLDLFEMAKELLDEARHSDAGRAARTLTPGAPGCH
jgi:ApbE family